MNRRLLALAFVPLLAACQQPAGPTTSTAATPSTTATSATTTPSRAATTSARPTSASPTSASPTAKASTTAVPSVSGSRSVSQADIDMMTAATGFIQKYWSVVDDMRNAGGSPETEAKLKDVATGAALAYWVEAAQQWREGGIYTVGRYTVVYADQQMLSVGNGKGTATFRYCVDTSTAEFKTRDPQGAQFSRRPERYRTGVATITWVDGGWKYADAQEKATNAC